MGGASALSRGPIYIAYPPSLFMFSQLLHLNQAGVQHLIGNLTKSHAGMLRDGHKGVRYFGLDVLFESTRSFL